MHKESILARLRLAPTSDGGRSTPIRPSSGDYRPHVRVAGGELLGIRMVEGPAILSPGEEAEVVFEPMYLDRVDYSPLSTGVQFELMEGKTVIGLGTVVHRVSIDARES